MIMIRVVVTTFSDEEAAAAAVRALVSESLAACGTIVPSARSIYRWKGQIEDCAEVVVIFKTTQAAFPSFEARLRELHPYETPEILAFDPAAAGDAYACWVDECCLPPQGGG